MPEAKLGTCDRVFWRHGEFRRDVLHEKQEYCENWREHPAQGEPTMSNVMYEEPQPKCELCGQPMPLGEEMFKYHGHSGPCPKPRREQPAQLSPQADAEMARRMDEYQAGEQPAQGEPLISGSRSVALGFGDGQNPTPGWMKAAACGCPEGKCKGHAGQEGVVEGMSAEQFHKVNLDTWGIYRWQYDSALFRFAESYAALKVREALDKLK